MPNYLRGISLGIIFILAIASALAVYSERLSSLWASERDVATLRADAIGRDLGGAARALEGLARRIDARATHPPESEALEEAWRFVPGTISGLGTIGDEGPQVGRELDAIRAHAPHFDHLTGRRSHFPRIVYRSESGFSYRKPPVAIDRISKFHAFATRLEWDEQAGTQWQFAARDGLDPEASPRALWVGVPLSTAGPARGVLAARVRSGPLHSLLRRGESIGWSALTTGTRQWTGGGNGSGTRLTERDSHRDDPFLQKRLTGNLRLIHRFPPGEPYWAAARASLVPWAIVAIAATLVGVTVHKAQRVEINERRRAERALREAYHNQQDLASRLRRLANELTTVQQRERKRLAALLHDHLQQLLVAARFKYGLGRHEEACDLIAQAIDESRHLTQQLRPPALYEAGIIPALHWLAEQCEHQYSLAVTVDAPQPDATEALSDEAKMALFEGVRELLFNVAKHASVERATVTIRSTAARLWINVEDLGTGFDATAAEPALSSSETCFGLFSLKERMVAIGGDMTIDSKVGQGTTVRLSVPFQPRTE